MPGYEIEVATFSDVLTLWRDHLWPNRQSPIEPTSAMQWLGGIDMSLMRSEPTFWIARDRKANEPIGCLSGHFGGMISSVRAYRTRGLWVTSQARRHGVARKLMLAAFTQASVENCKRVWTFPRMTSMPFYESLGFQRAGEWIDSAEFGPNCYAVAEP